MLDIKFVRENPDKVKYPDIKQKYRFELVNNEMEE